MTDSSDAGVIREYGVHANYEAVCLDGPNLDRLVWLGDFMHTARIIATSTSRFDLARSTLKSILLWQSELGLLPYEYAMGYDPTLASDVFSLGDGGSSRGQDGYAGGLVDYQILGLQAFAHYVRRSNDLEFVHETWSQWQRPVEWLVSNINSTTGLLSVFQAFLGPSNGGSAINCAFVEALKKLVDVATAVGDGSAATKYLATAAQLMDAINSKLWNEELGVYSLSPEYPNDFSVNSIGFCISSGTANATRAARLLSALPSLRLGPGYKYSTQDNSSDPTINISPNTNGFLLEGIMSHNSPSAVTTAIDLIKTLWTPMINNRSTDTGASWEYVSQDGTPGLGLFTSLSHPWGGAPTYLLTDWVAGIQGAERVQGFGYANWVVNPYVGVTFGLKHVSARVVTALGGNLEVHWEVDENVKSLQVTVRAPVTSSGVFELGRTKKVLTGAKEYSFSVELWPL